MIDPLQFQRLVIDPAIREIGAYSPSASALLLGTAITESRLRYLEQLGEGPALGVFQIEPRTRADVDKNYLKYRPELKLRVGRLMTDEPPATQLITNLSYACAIARIIYLRSPDPLPDADDISGLANYWKKIYNTRVGRGEASSFIGLAGPYLT